MQKQEILNILTSKLAPVYHARYEFVNKVDPLFFKSATGEAELLNMALFSDFVQKLPSDMALKHIHDDYFSTMSVYSNKESFLKPIRQSGWNIDFNQQTFRRLIHRFAQDAGVDSFYNAVDNVPKEKAPIDRLGHIKNWDNMKHSQVLSADIPHYYIHNELHQTQSMQAEKIAAFCNEQKNPSHPRTKQPATLISRAISY